MDIYVTHVSPQEPSKYGWKEISEPVKINSNNSVWINTKGEVYLADAESPLNEENQVFLDIKYQA